LRAVQQLHRAGTAHLIFQALQRGAFFLQLPVQRARRYMQQRGQRFETEIQKIMIYGKIILIKQM